MKESSVLFCRKLYSIVEEIGRSEACKKKTIVFNKADTHKNHVDTDCGGGFGNSGGDGCDERSVPRHGLTNGLGENSSSRRACMRVIEITQQRMDGHALSDSGRALSRKMDDVNHGTRHIREGLWRKRLAFSRLFALTSMTICAVRHTHASFAKEDVDGSSMLAAARPATCTPHNYRCAQTRRWYTFLAVAFRC